MQEMQICHMQRESCTATCHMPSLLSLTSLDSSTLILSTCVSILHLSLPAFPFSQEARKDSSPELPQCPGNTLISTSSF